MALLAGTFFDVDENSGFVEVILQNMLDKYVASRRLNSAEDPHIQAIFERMVRRCVESGSVNQAVGIAVDALRLDIVESILKGSGSPEVLRFVQQISRQQPQSVAKSLLSMVVAAAESASPVDWIFVCECLVMVGDSRKCAAIINELGEAPIALQLCFNLVNDAPQDFLAYVHYHATSETAKSVLSGTVTTRLHLEFLSRRNHSDQLILERTKEALNATNSLHHTGLSIANAFMQAGTTNDEFLRKNLEWLSFASNWSKFTAAAALGVIHRGQLDNCRTVLAPYLPRETVASSSSYSEGGALMALGMVHARRGGPELRYLEETMRSCNGAPAKHGAALGIGAVGMGCQDPSLLSSLKSLLFDDETVSGEAAAIAVGLVGMGDADEVLTGELLEYVGDVEHEKVLRGIGLAIALIYYEATDRAETIIAHLIENKDPILRYGGVWTVAMAYAGTGSNQAVRKLLHAAVSDSDDNVRRAAVMGLAFVLFKSPDEVPHLVELLSQSFNPHVRYGAAMALGLVYAGTGSAKALELIQPMAKDLTDFVRQAAFIAQALVLQQQTGPLAADFRDQLEKSATNKYEDALARLGAVLGQGLIDAGGRNVVVQLASPSGHNRMEAIAGAMLFCQLWYWYPLSLFLSLSFTPTAVIAVDATLRPPKFSLTCAAKPSQFAYPPPTVKPVAAASKKLVSAVLSTTKSKKAKTDMEVDPEPVAPKPEPVEEPSSFLVENCSRVTLSQRALVTYTDPRFQPLSQSNGIVIVFVSEPVEYLNLADQNDKNLANQDNDKKVTPPPTFEADI